MIVVRDIDFKEGCIPPFGLIIAIQLLQSCMLSIYESENTLKTGAEEKETILTLVELDVVTATTVSYLWEDGSDKDKRLLLNAKRYLQKLHRKTFLTFFSFGYNMLTEVVRKSPMIGVWRSSD